MGWGAGWRGGRAFWSRFLDFWTNMWVPFQGLEWLRGRGWLTQRYKGESLVPKATQALHNSDIAQMWHLGGGICTTSWTPEGGTIQSPLRKRRRGAFSGILAPRMDSLVMGATLSNMRLPALCIPKRGSLACSIYTSTAK